MDTKVRTRNGRFGSQHLPWTPERRETLRTLWLEGKSATQIAKVLGGTTRNAVIGVANRSGLRRYESGSPREKVFHCRGARQRTRPRRAPAEVAVKLIQGTPEPLLPPIGAHCILDAEPGTCRFICDDVRGPYQLCGHPGEPWCGAHRAIVYGREKNPGVVPERVPLRRIGRIVATTIGTAFGQ